MTTAQHRSGLAIVAPSGAYDRADGLHLLRDDEKALPLDTIPPGSPAALATPEIRLVKWTTLAKEWTMLVPNALMHGDPDCVEPLPILATRGPGPQGPNRHIMAIALDESSRVMTYYRNLPDTAGQPMPRMHVIHLLRELDVALTGFRDLDNESFRMPTHPPRQLSRLELRMHDSPQQGITPPLYPRAQAGAGSSSGAKRERASARLTREQTTEGRESAPMRGSARGRQGGEAQRRG